MFLLSPPNASPPMRLSSCTESLIIHVTCFKWSLLIDSAVALLSAMNNADQLDITEIMVTAISRY